MAFPLRLIASVSGLLSICLSIAILGTAGSILHMYRSQRDIDPWWLPLWPQHFDDRGLKTLIGGSVAIVILNALAVAAQHKAMKAQNQIVLAFASLATMAAAVEIIYPAVLNQQAPNRDTMQSWTCRWSATTKPISAGVPSNFGTLCTQNKFAFYATIPVFILQLIILGLVMWSAKKSGMPDEMLTRKDGVEKSEQKAATTSERSVSREE